MISPANGDVSFTDGLLLSTRRVPDGALSSSHLPLPGWTQHDFGPRPSEYGEFEVTAVCEPGRRICVVLLSHRHEFYEKGTPSDEERRVFHEGILGRDLRGQREFSWGQAFCSLDARHNRSCLVVAYAAGPHVPLSAACQLIGLEDAVGY